MTEQEEDQHWEPEQQATENENDMKVWITDSKNNVKYAITQLNYSQVY